MTETKIPIYEVHNCARCNEEHVCRQYQGSWYCIPKCMREVERGAR